MNENLSTKLINAWDCLWGDGDTRVKIRNQDLYQRFVGQMDPKATNQFKYKPDLNNLYFYELVIYFL